MFRACDDNNIGNPSSSSLDSEVIITDVKKIKKTKEMVETQNGAVQDAERKEQSGESEETNVFLETDLVDRSDTIVLRKLLRRPRYFDLQDSSWGNCYNCGEAGHTVANCIAAKRRKPCFLCGSLEHNAKRCKQGKNCFICQKGGHRAKDCPEKSTGRFQKDKLCMRCGDSGHDMFICKTIYSVDDLKEIQCYVCKCFGHLCCVNYATVPREVSCYRCGQLGHIGLECSSVSAQACAETTSTMSLGSCYKCGEEGHKARKCTRSAKKRKRKADFARSKLSHSKDNGDHVAVRSAPHDLGEACERNKTQYGRSSSSQSKHRGGWITEDPNDYYRGNFNANQWGSPSTPASYRSNNSFHGNHGPSAYVSGFQFESSGSNGDPELSV